MLPVKIALCGFLFAANVSALKADKIDSAMGASEATREDPEKIQNVSHGVVDEDERNKDGSEKKRIVISAVSLPRT